MRIFIIGVNGFIGNALVRQILEATKWLVTKYNKRLIFPSSSVENNR